MKASEQPPRQRSVILNEICYLLNTIFFTVLVAGPVLMEPQYISKFFSVSLRRL